MTIRQQLFPGMIAAREVATLMIVVYGALAALGWLQTGSLNAALLSGSALLGVAWMAGVAADGWMLWHGWAIIGMAAIAWSARERTLKHLHAFQMTQERLEETQHQCSVELAQLEQSVAGLQRRLERYRALQEVARELTQSMDLTRVAHLIVTQTFQMVGKSSACLLFLLDRATQSLALTASHRAQGVPPISAKQGDVFDAGILRMRRGAVIEDVTRDPRYMPEEFRGRTARALVATPLIVDRRVEGVLRLESAEPNIYTQEDLRLLDILAELAATVVATARLYAQTQELAMTDGLTGLLVRRALEESLRTELMRAERRHETRALLMVDIDHFKRYNDTLGHAAGDLVLKGVARILKERAGADGLVARYGGEEFTVLLHVGDPAQALQQSQDIRQAIAEEPFVLRRETTHVTVSIGIAHFPADGREPLELVRIADERLYRAKQSGRNRVCAS